MEVFAQNKIFIPFMEYTCQINSHKSYIPNGCDITKIDCWLCAFPKLIIPFSCLPLKKVYESASH